MKRVLLQLVLLFSVSINAIAQTHTVTGKVVDEHGQSISGSDISVSGANVGTISDINGDWLLEVPDGKIVFYVQALGYNAKTIEDSSQFLLIQLQSASKEQEGTIVTPFGARRDKREAGYIATTLNNEELGNGNNPSAVSALAGKVTGANISSNGGFGGTSSIVFRGDKSFLQNSNALIVVDGVILNNFQRTTTAQGISNLYNQLDFGNSANDINPEDIASVTVIEGAAAATLYGSAGANGAIMITTKSGVEGCKNKKMEISVKTGYSEFQVLKTPDVQHQYGQGDIYSGLNDYRTTNYSWGLPFDNALRPWGQIIRGKQLIKPYADMPNNLKDFFNTGNALNNYVSVKGGDENSTYFLSFNSVNSTGIIPNDFYNKYNVRFNGTINLTNNFYSAINVNYMNSYSRSEYEGDGGSTGNAGIMENVINTPRDIPLTELSNLSNMFYSMNYIDTSGAHRYGNYSSKTMNPYWAAKYFDNRNTSDRLTGNLKIGYKKGDFDVFERVGVDVNADRSNYQTPQYIVTATDQTGLYPGTGYIGTGFNSNGGYAQAHYNGIRIYNDLIGNFNHEITRNISFSATVGTSVNIMHDANFNSVIDPKSNGLLIPDFYNFSNNTGPVVSANSIMDHRVVGIFGDFRFNYQRELYLEFTGRNDWSSAFNYFEPHFYPGANLSWIFTERLKGAIKDKVLNYGKIRFGAAGAGNDAPSYANNNAGYQQLPIASTNGYISTPFNSMSAYQVQRTFGDQNLKPELTREYETGVDLSFLKDRITFSFTYYNAYSYNLIAALPVAPSSGFAYNFVNIGDVTNRGEEVVLRGTPIYTKYGLRCDLFVTYTHNVNNVVDIANSLNNVVLGSADGMEVVAAKDHPLGTFYAPDISYWQNPKDGTWHPIVDATTGLPVPTSKPVYKGSYQPKFIASWGTDVSWSGIKLHVLFTTKQGGQFYSHDKYLMDVNGTAQETTVNSRKPLVWANSVNQIGTTNNYVTNTTKYLPYDYYVNEIGGKLVPGQGLVDASYIKLQEISLSYKIPQKYYAKTVFGGLEAGLYGTNLVIWTARGNQYGDPELATTGFAGSNLGINYSARPAAKNYGFYVKVTF